MMQNTNPNKYLLNIHCKNISISIQSMLFVIISHWNKRIAMYLIEFDNLVFIFHVEGLEVYIFVHCIII